MRCIVSAGVHFWYVLSHQKVYHVYNIVVKLSQRGFYDNALARMEEIEPETLRILRYSQYWTVHLGLLKLRRHLHRLVYS